MNSISKTTLRLLSAAVLVLTSGVSHAETPAPQRLSLWPYGAPNGDGTIDKAGVPVITVHLPSAGKANGSAFIICPGGGYGGLVTGGEGHGIAEWLGKNGIAGIVLEYRLPKGRADVPRLDAAQAIRTARSHATEWHLDPKRIGIIGFSAGGHLASTAVTHFDGGNPESADPVERASSRPDFAILVYPVISMGSQAHGGSRTNLLGPSPTQAQLDFFSAEKNVTDKTPPVYLAHALDDTVVTPKNSADFRDAMKAKGRPVEYIELASGGHGLNGYRGPMWDAWQKGSLEWLVAQKLIPAPAAK